jgi:hypothetical protein
MPLRLPCKPVSLSPGNLLFPYWGALGFHRPVFDVIAIGPRGVICWEPARIDTGADETVFSSAVALSLGLTLPFPRQLTISGALGTQAATLSFPPEGLVSLFVTDYTEYCYFPAPLIGFHPPGPTAANQRSVLGLTGFLQYFLFTLDPTPTPSLIVLDPIAAFPGQTGLLPKDGPLLDFIRGLRGGP